MEVEISNYYKNSKESGAIQGNFALTIQPNGQKILFCKHFKTATSEWFSFPSHKVEKDSKTDYIPYVSYSDKEYAEQLKIAVLQAIHALPESEIRQSKRFEFPKKTEEKSWF